MRYILQIMILSTVIFTFTVCEQFSTSYQRVDHTELRLLNFLYYPPDAAPGDDVVLVAVFAGKEIDLDNDLEWWISFNVIRDIFGSETVVDSMRLEPIVRRKKDYHWSDNTQAVRFKFKIPDDIVLTSAAIPEVWTDMLPSYLLNTIPPALAAMTKSEVVAAINKLTTPPVYIAGSEQVVVADVERVIAVHKAISDSLQPDMVALLNNIDFLPILLQYFTVPMRISVKTCQPGRLPHTMVSSHSVRYNNRLSHLHTVPINRNPYAQDIVVYKIEGENSVIRDTVNRSYFMIPLAPYGYHNAEILVESGYSYFLRVYSSDRDYSITMFGNMVVESHWAYYQFMLDKEETAGVHHTRFMDIDSYTGRLTMPTDKRITRVVFWASITDEVQNERMRPQGATLYEATARLVYR